MTSIPVRNAFSRVFLIERRARGDRAPTYKSSLIAGAVEQSFGDIERIEVPDPNQYGEFLEVATLRGAEERASTSLSGRYASDLASDLIRLAKIKCASDVQVHFGTCTIPSEFNQFTKAVVLENASLINASVDELGTLSSDDQSVVNEQAEISAENWYEILPLKFSERAASLVANEVLDVVISDSVACGDCDDESDGCDKVYAVSKAAPGSAGTPSDLLYSPDNGVTWYITDVDNLGANDPDGVAVVGDYVVVISNAGGGYHYLDKSELALLVNGSGDPAFSAAVTTGIVASSEPNDIWSLGSTAFLVGDAGYVYKMTDALAGVTAVETGNATSENLQAVHAMDSSNILAGGANGAVIYSLDGGTTWTLVGAAPAAATINAVWMLSTRVFWVGTAGGQLFYTTDQGDSWTEKTFSGSGSGSVHDIAFATDSVMYVSHATSANVGRLLRSYDAGYSFVVLPESVGSLPANDRLTAIATCTQDPNLIIGVGLGDDAADGIIIRGVD